VRLGAVDKAHAGSVEAVLLEVLAELAGTQVSTRYVPVKDHAPLHLPWPCRRGRGGE
jgi:hypothetical protein